MAARKLPILRMHAMDVSHLEHQSLQDEAKNAERNAIHDGRGEGVKAGEGAVEELGGEE